MCPVHVETRASDASSVSHPPSLVSETGSLPRAHCRRWMAGELQGDACLPLQSWDHRLTPLTFYVVSEHLDLGPHDCVVNIVPVEPLKSQMGTILGKKRKKKIIQIILL